MKSGPRSPQLEKALAQKRRPNTAKKKKKKKKKNASEKSFGYKWQKFDSNQEFWYSKNVLLSGNVYLFSKQKILIWVIIGAYFKEHYSRGSRHVPQALQNERQEMIENVMVQI